MFHQSMKGADYLGFIANLINCIKLGRNTSFDEKQTGKKIKKSDSYSESGKRGIVFVMDNASIHIAGIVKNVL